MAGSSPEACLYKGQKRVWNEHNEGKNDAGLPALCDGSQTRGVSPSEEGRGRTCFPWLNSVRPVLWNPLLGQQWGDLWGQKPGSAE